jgi:hypothetical protein
MSRITNRWHIQGFEGLASTYDSWVPGRLSELQVMKLLARLHCRHLTDAEVIASTLDSRDRAKLGSMVVPNQGRRGGYMTAGDPHYTAVYEEFKSAL